MRFQKRVQNSHAIGKNSETDLIWWEQLCSLSTDHILFNHAMLRSAFTCCPITEVITDNNIRRRNMLLSTIPCCWQIIGIFVGRSIDRDVDRFVARNVDRIVDTCLVLAPCGPPLAPCGSPLAPCGLLMAPCGSPMAPCGTPLTPCVPRPW